MTADAFEKIWEQASTRHPTGLVKTSFLLRINAYFVPLTENPIRITRQGQITYLLFTAKTCMHSYI